MLFKVPLQHLIVYINNNETLQQYLKWLKIIFPETLQWLY